MYTLIDSDNYSAAGVETMFFPGGEPHVKTGTVSGDVLLFLKLRTWADVGFGALMIDALYRSLNVNCLRMFIPYFPGARQDKPSPGTAATLKLMLTLLATKHPVYAFDPHSSVLRDALGLGRSLMPAQLSLVSKPDVVGIIAPDAGAHDRAEAFRAKLYPQAEIISCGKRRDSHTGMLSGYHMPQLPTTGRYIIVDDICDGGGTFNLLAAEFKKDSLSSQSSLELFVSHGIFSKGLDAIDPVIANITTTDSWCRLPASPRLTVLPLAPLFPLIMGEPSA